MNVIRPNATSHQLETAIVQNHCDLFLLDARIKDGTIRMEEGLCWTYIRADASGSIFFPALSDGAAKLNEMMDFCHIHPIRNLECWSLDPSGNGTSGCNASCTGLSAWMASLLDGVRSRYHQYNLCIAEGLAYCP